MQWIALLIAALTFAGIAIGRLPPLRMNRATIALVGATSLAVIGTVSIETAFDLIDWNTLSLLLAMMILNANLRICGFFQWTSLHLMEKVHHPLLLLGSIVLLAGILSSLLLNDTIVLMFTPLAIEIMRAQRRNPIPFLMALALSANIGSVATMIGNPQNMLIGINSGLAFLHFTFVLAPLALIGLVFAFLLVWIVYRRELSTESEVIGPAKPVRIFRPLFIKSLMAAIFILIAIGAGMPLPLAALSGSAFLLITRRLKPERVFREVDWGLLVFFSGLFVVTGAVERIPAGSLILESIQFTSGDSIPGLAISAAVLSNIVSNVPAVLLLKPVVGTYINSESAWLTLAMASTFSGNLTLLGSAANLIVAEIARRQGVTIGFMEYLKTGFPVTISTLILGIIYLMALNSR